MMRYLIPVFFSFLLIAFLTSCEHDADLPLISNGVDSSVCFENKILPIIANNCAVPGCHDGSGEQTPLTNYLEITSKIKAGDPNASKLYQSIVPNRFTRKAYMPPSPKHALSNEDVTLIELWILEEGNTFSKVVLPIFQTNCQNGCHDGPYPSNNLLLTNYHEIVAAINDSSLYTHLLPQDTTVFHMPPYQQISDCDLSKINKWISNGLPNN